MDPNTEQKNNDVIFLGINFNNFFKNCSCVKRTLDLESDTGSNDEKKRLYPIERKKPPKNDFHMQPYAIQLDDDVHSVASSTDWADLEEIPLPNNLALRPDDNIQQVTLAEANYAVDEYYTQEPIDFDFLKEADVNVKEEDEKSATSGLSKGSKKIRKEESAAKNRQTGLLAAQKENQMIKGKRKAWQPYEDSQVLELVAKYGQSWAVIASMMEGRTGKQIRDRYLNKLRPNIKRGDWMPDEDALLLSLYYQIGHKWSKIATYLPGRTEGQVKNRFYSHIKKKLLGQESDQMSGEASPSELFQNPPVEKMMTESPTNYQGYPKGPQYSPTSSSGTMTTQPSKIQSEREVDDILDRMVGFMGKKPTVQMNVEASPFDLEKMPLEKKVAIIENSEYNNPVERVNHLENLQKRKAKLEMLLAQTMRDMTVVNPSVPQGNGNGYHDHTDNYFS